jgi:hypothetical protein
MRHDSLLDVDNDADLCPANRLENQLCRYRS